DDGAVTDGGAREDDAAAADGDVRSDLHRHEPYLTRLEDVRDDGALAAEGGVVADLEEVPIADEGGLEVHAPADLRAEPPIEPVEVRRALQKLQEDLIGEEHQVPCDAPLHDGPREDVKAPLAQLVEGEPLVEHDAEAQRRAPQHVAEGRRR